MPGLTARGAWAALNDRGTAGKIRGGIEWERILHCTS